MYSVKITNGSSSKIIHDDRVNIRLSDTKIATTINQASSFTFNLYPNNPGWDLLHEYTTGIEVWKLSKLLFKGRVMSVQTNYTNEGQLLKQVSCESQLAFLNDSIQSYKKVQMTPKAFFTFLIGEHNKQVSADRQFKVGRVDVTNSTNNVYCYIEDGLNTFEEIDADLLKNESLGGELWIRNEANGVYIDWLRDGVTKGRQQIRMNKNMLSVYSKPDLNGLCTVLYPFGATPEEGGTSTDDKASDVASPRLTIESVNGGKKYLEDSELISKFGRISGSKTWDDVKVAANLKTKGQAYLNTFKAVKIGYELEAVDLQPLNLAVDDFETGKYYQVVNPLEGLNDYLRIIAMSIDLNAPLQSGITIGDRSVPLSKYQLENQNAAKQANKLKQQINSYANRITSLDEKTKEMSKTIESQEAQLNSTDSTMHPWSNMSVTVLGDSITYGQINGSDSHADPRWTDYLVSVSKFKNVDNKGIAGAKIAVTAAAERIEPISITAESVSGQDMVIVFGGINDFIGIGKGLGDMSSTDVSTFYGALKHIVSTLRANNPTAKLVFITPMKEKLTGSETFNEDGSLRENTDGHTQLEYITAIQNVCNFYSLNVINLYNNCDINPYLDNSFFQDGLHPTQEGYRKLGQQIAREINKI